MHYQLYDEEEEFEPRITPKPLSKHECFLVPTVPEVSFILEKATVRHSNDERPVQISDNPNSYAAWKEQNYSRQISSTTHISPLDTLRQEQERLPSANKKDLDRRALSSDVLQRPAPHIQHVPDNPNYNMDETVKTLLQVVNSQNEQIKNLQLKVDRLVRMQEENFNNKPACLCSQPLANQVFRYPINCYDPALTSSLAQSQHQGSMKNAVTSQNTSVIKKQDLENFSENTKLEQQSKKAYMEQKVSIGVMTSFEFTVQNSPFPIDSEMSEKKEAHREGNNGSRTNDTRDITEPINRYKNTLTRKPGGAQLENIVEDSESYLSSSQQRSNCNASSSVKESLKMHPYLPTDLNREETHDGMYTGKDGRVPNAKKTLNSSINVDEKNVNLPASDYYRNHYRRNKEYGANVRQKIKDVGDSMNLSGGDLKILERSPPTPEASIHVEMQEYTSDDESDQLRHTSKIGWTFYNNVLGQVNEILQNSSVLSAKDLNEAKPARKVEQENDTALDTVKAATLEQLRRLGISLTENNEHGESNDNKTLDFDSSFYPRFDYQANMTRGTSVVNETNTSMHMKALALKYLSDEQLADLAWHKQDVSSSLKHVMLSNMQGTDMSLATMRYLERYQLLPGKNNVQTDNIEQVYDRASFKHDFKPVAANNNPALRRFPFVQTSGATCPSRILDLSALKRQPKLL